MTYMYTFSHNLASSHMHGLIRYQKTLHVFYKFEEKKINNEIVIIFLIDFRNLGNIIRKYI